MAAKRPARASLRYAKAPLSPRYRRELHQLPGHCSASTTTKFVGGLSAKDARALAGDMRTDEAFLLSAKKEHDKTNFACFVRNATPTAIMVPVEFGQMERISTLSEAQYERLLDANRGRYCLGATVPSTTAPVAPKDKGESGFKLGSQDLL